jgi:hypothetical protein
MNLLGEQKVLSHSGIFPAALTSTPHANFFLAFTIASGSEFQCRIISYLKKE